MISEIHHNVKIRIKIQSRMINKNNDLKIDAIDANIEHLGSRIAEASGYAFAEKDQFCRSLLFVPGSR